MTRGTKTEYSGRTFEQRKTQAKQSLRPITITKENKFMKTFSISKTDNSTHWEGWKQEGATSVAGGNADVWKVV